MSVTESKPYHHGDLQRALVAAARSILEADGPSALSMRAVAAAAGVTQGAPYHHFRNKDELLAAVAEEGWCALGEALDVARDAASCAEEAMIELGVAYVVFARARPHLYRVMFDTARVHSGDEEPEGDSAFDRVRSTLIEAGADPADGVGLQLTALAAWCGAHGVAEMAGFAQLEPLKSALGGERALIRALFAHMGPPARA